MDANDAPVGEEHEDALIRGQMERMVGSYDAYMRTVTLGRERLLRRMTVQLARIQSGDSVLEVGCGTGTLALAAKRRAGPSGKVFGIDVLPGMIEASQRKATQAGEQVDFRLGSIAEIPFPGGHFDVVLSSFMIFHMAEATRRKGLAEIQRVLKPQGRLLILDLTPPARPLPRAIARMLFDGMLNHDLEELRPELAASGFADIEIAPAGFRVLGLQVVSFVRAVARPR